MCLPSPHIVFPGLIGCIKISKLARDRGKVPFTLHSFCSLIHNKIGRKEKKKKKKKLSPFSFFFTISDDKSTRLLLVARRKLLSQTLQNNSNKRKYLGSITTSKKRTIFHQVYRQKKKDHTFSSADTCPENVSPDVLHESQRMQNVLTKQKKKKTRKNKQTKKIQS